MDERFSDNQAEGRFELDIAGQIAFANYRRTDDDQHYEYGRRRREICRDLLRESVRD